MARDRRSEGETRSECGEGQGGTLRLELNLTDLNEQGITVEPPK